MRADPAAASAPSRLGAASRRLLAAAAGFVTSPASPLPLGVLRIGIGVLVALQALAFLPCLGEAYGARGLVQSPLVDVLVPPLAPRVGWVVAALAPLGLGETFAIRAVFALHLAAAIALTVGWRTRAAAVCAWATFVAMTTSGPLQSYGIDAFLRIALFWCVFAPVGAALSCDVLSGRTSGAPSAAARLALRVLQAHLVVVYVSSGIEKASGAQWWDGEALWRALMRPDLGTLDFGFVAGVPWLARVGCWATLVLEIGYGVFVWPRRTRRAWTLAVIGMHLGIAATLGLWAFSATMALLSAAAWLVPSEPCTERRPRASGFVVGYDGTCRVCRAAVALAFSLDRAGFLPVGRRYALRMPARAVRGRLDRMVTVDRDGRVSFGADAFFAMWAHALSRPWIARLGHLAPVRAGYSLFARHRHALGCRGACERSVADVVPHRAT
jgi:predicted DCC family thiol-disulfide oxidoreductase YuxK